MKDRFFLTFQLIKENWRTLLLFEVIYRIIGLAIIFPLANQLLYASISIQGKSYITNADFIEYIFDPVTIFIYLIIIILFGIYVLFEIVTLSYLFHETYYKNPIHIESLLLTALLRTMEVLKKYHLTIILSSLVFFGLIEVLHIAGIASTINIPDIITEQITSVLAVQIVFVGSIMILVLLFFMTIFYEIQCVIANRSFKASFSHSKKIMKGNYLAIVIDFLVLNGLLNFILYVLYLFVICVVALIVMITVNQAALLGIMLSGVYTIYLSIGFVGTILLMPFNFAWINAWYYEHKVTKDIDLEKTFNLYTTKPSILRNLWFRRIMIGLLVIVIGLNVILIQRTIFSNDNPIQLFDNPAVIAHRGSSFDAPENTLSAIQKAIDDGADAVEVDVRFTSDSIPVLMHDPTTQRTTNDSQIRYISETTLEELQKLDVGSWFDPAFENERIATLEEALLLARQGNIDLYIELKASHPNIVNILLELFTRTRMSNHIKLLSFNGLLLEQIKAENDRIETVMLLSSFLGNLEVLIENTYIDTYGLRYTLIMNNTDYVRRLKESGKKIYVYTVNDPDRIIEMNKLGVDGIISDVPILTRELVYQDTTSEQFDQILEALFKRN
jgi:glycerophosphoryl diester phosphodiesterase